MLHQRILGRSLLAALIGLASTVTSQADAFCGFYVSGADAKLFNNATQVVMMREGTRTVLSMQNNYQGPPSDFAMVVPVPVILQKENVKTLPREVFAQVDQLDSPRLVEYWEQDPCASPPSRRAKGGGARSPAPPAAAAPGKADGLGVTVEAQFTVGEYEVVILSAKDASGLDTWLKQEKYTIPAGSAELFRPYVQAGSKFFVARVDAKKVSFDAQGMATLSPLRFHYDSEQFSLPVRLGLVNSNGTQDLIVHILAKGQRYEVANYPNATIPTNFDVAENARDKFGSFYASLFDRTMEKNPKAVVTEYSWDASTCDPCPGPALSFNDLATLGADALVTAALGDEGTLAPPPTRIAPPPPVFPKSPGGTTAPSPPPRPSPPSRPPMTGRRMGSMPSGFVITRLHARYSKDSLGEDLVFRAAPPIVGGREIRTGEELEHGASPSSVNNFQGRYAIRHPWGGPITCKEPVRNQWGGPPVDHSAYGSTSTKAAKDLAFVPRDEKLASFVRTEIKELNLKGEGLAVSPVMPAAAALPKPGTDDPLQERAPVSGSGDVTVKRGCLGCATTPTPIGSAGGLTLLGIGALLGRRRARKEKR